MTELPPNVALVHLFVSARSEADASDRLAAMLEDAKTCVLAGEMAAMWRQHPQAFDTVRRVDALARGGSRWDAVFDAAAAVDLCTAVALYSLGDARLLRAATDELVGRMQSWGILSGGSVVLDFGCGTGRVVAAIAPLVKRVLGVDASSRMVDVARAAVARHANAAVIRAETLSALRGDHFDAVLAIDSLPYLVDGGTPVAIWEDVAGLLNPGGVFLIMNYSYRGDPARDGDEVAWFAVRHGFAIIRKGTQDMDLWDGRAFLLRKT